MKSLYHFILLMLGLGFAILFSIIIIPPFLKDPDLFSAFGAGFVNPYSTGYSFDTIFCWLILSTWIVYEAKTKKIQKGWICILLGIMPGVATGFALYLWMRSKQINSE
jgi:hypothetical protein